MVKFLGKNKNGNEWQFGLLAVIGLVLSIGSSFFMFANKDIAPDWDMVSVINFLMHGAAGSEPNLLSADLFRFTINEHQPYIPMLIWGIDFKAFGSYGLLPQILMQVFAICFVVLATSWSRPRPDTHTFYAYAVLLSGCALSLCYLHWENLVWPNQILLYTSILFSIIAISLAASISKRNWRHQVLRALFSGFFAICATFSFGWGLVVWPVLVIHGLLTRWAWQSLVTMLFLCLGTLTVYFLQFSGGTHPGNPAESLIQPWSVMHFSALLLGSPLVVLTGMNYLVGYVFGYLLLALFFGVAFQVYFRRKELDELQMRSLMICLFCIGVCVLTSLGRSALAYRYMVIPTLFFLAFPGLFPLRPPMASKLKRRCAILFLSGVLVMSGASFLSDNSLRNKQFMIREGTISATFGTHPLYRGLSPSPSKINEVVWPFYLKHHGDTQPLKLHTWLGKPMPQTAVPETPSQQETNCKGRVDRIEIREGYPGLVIPHGWIRLGPEGQRQAKWVVITDSSGMVVGLATTGIKRPDVREHLNASWLDDLMTQSHRAGFIGFIRSQPGESLNFYAYDDEKCYLFEKMALAAEGP
ncbi:MAG: hypothetical protein KJT03_10395 [Verrucomicrobiae bacterium]|nr:hypothetical protein [Verrucomicrobiae bacterium]